MAYDSRRFVGGLLVAVACAIFAWPEARATVGDTAAYLDEIETWHRERTDRLTAEDGWLTLIGLFWLEEGKNTMGSAPGSRILLPASKAPDRAAILTLEGESVHIEVAGDVVVTRGGQPVTSAAMAADTTAEPTVLDLGDLRFFVIERGGRLGLRVRDRAHPARFDFTGIDRFPVDPGWRVAGRLERHDPPRSVHILNVLGVLSEEPSPGTVVFELGGRTCRLDALQGPEGRLYLIFADQTSGRETYGGGRYLYSEPVQPDGTVVLDFNKAYNPPCAFTDFATCPLPPRQNRLPIRVEAGEKSFGDH